MSNSSIDQNIVLDKDLQKGYLESIADSEKIFQEEIQLILSLLQEVNITQLLAFLSMSVYCSKRDIWYASDSNEDNRELLPNHIEILQAISLTISYSQENQNFPTFPRSIMF